MRTHVNFSQCDFGARAPKPTAFVLLRCARLMHILHSIPKPGKCSHSKHTPHIGRDSSGQWLTSPLKVYPGGLCRAIAQGVVFELSGQCEEFREPTQIVAEIRCLDSGLLRLYSSHDRYMPDMLMRHDWHRS